MFEYNMSILFYNKKTSTEKKSKQATMEKDTSDTTKEAKVAI
jgi:hypothetical protein